MAQASRRPEGFQATYVERTARLKRIEANPHALEAAKLHYRAHPWDFVNDWGMTFDPRLLEGGGQPVVPFLLWPRQVEYLKWLDRMWRTQERGLVEKSRDCGVTWLSIGFACVHWLFTPGFVCKVGSRKEELVDKSGDFDSIFVKCWFFLTSVPHVFWPRGFSEECRAHLRVVNPENGSAITGEAGDNIGRGGRASIALVDEAAFIEHQELVDSALSQTTNCQIDISTPNGPGNSFARKRQRIGRDAPHRLFIFDWHDDPRKDDAWYQKQKEELDPVTVAQEIDRDYNASSTDAFIPAPWVTASVDAHKRLGFDGEGIRAAGFDPADVGDARAVVCRHGAVVRLAKEKRSGDITHAVRWAFELADEMRSDVMRYDGDGLGEPVMKEALLHLTAKRCEVDAYHGSGGVESPGRHRKEQDTDERSNVDRYLNYRAQTWSAVRERFRKTWLAVEAAAKGQIVRADPADLISLDSECGELESLKSELSTPMRQWTPNGKIKVESKPDMKKRGVKSPNLADALVIAFSVTKIPTPDDVVDDSPAISSWESV